MFKRIAAATAAVLLGAGAFTACGTDSDSAGAESSAAVSTHSVAHFFGSTQVPDAPKRVVTVGYTDDQTVLALGIKPVGMVDQYENPAGTTPDINTQWPWVKDLWGSDVPEVIMNNGDSGPNLEKIAALKPDLIIAVYSEIDKATYDKLTAIAPTVGRNAAETEPFSGSWRDNVLQIARAVNKESEANTKLAAIDAQLLTQKEAHPEFAQQTAVAVSWYKDQVNPFSSKDVRGQVLTGLGFKSVPALDQLAGTDFSFALSNERLDLLNVDRLIVINDAADITAIKANPQFAQLAVVRDGKVVYLLDSEAPSVGAAMSQATLASMPFAIDEVTKAVANG